MAAKQKLIWERVQAQPREGSQLTYPRIVRAAIRLADRQGLDAISMRNIGKELATPVMSLYRYVASKDDVLDLLLDAAYGEIELPPRAPSWKDKLRASAMETRRMLKRRPWVAPLITSRPTMGPNYLRWFEFAMSAVAELGVDTETRIRAIGTLHAYVTGVVSYELGEQETNRRLGLTAEKKRQLAAPYLKTILASGQYPQLAEFVAQGSGEPSEAAFEFGLNCVIGGIEQALTSPRARVRSATRTSE